jgi:hypothetical protein
MVLRILGGSRIEEKNSFGANSSRYAIVLNKFLLKNHDGPDLFKIWSHVSLFAKHPNNGLHTVELAVTMGVEFNLRRIPIGPFAHIQWPSVL